jgi:hypothetical protein
VTFSTCFLLRYIGLVHLTALFVAKLDIWSGKTISDCCNTSVTVLSGQRTRISSSRILHLDQTLTKFDKTQPRAKTQTTARITDGTHRNCHRPARRKWRLVNYCTARLHVVAGVCVLCCVFILPYLLLNINYLVISYVNSSFVHIALRKNTDQNCCLLLFSSVATLVLAAGNTVL